MPGTARVTEKCRPSGSSSGQRPRAMSLTSPRLSKETVTAARRWSGPHGTPRSGLRRDRILQPADPLDLDHDPVAVAQQHLGVAPEAHAARGPGEHDVA